MTWPARIVMAMMGVRAMLIRVLLPAILVLLAGPVKSNPIYKCINDEGRVTYAAMPCYGERWKRMGTPEAPPPKRNPGSPISPEPTAKSSPTSATPADPRAAAALTNVGGIAK